VEVMDDIEFDLDDGEDVGNVCDDGDDDVVMVVETMIDDVEAIDETEFDREEGYVGAFDIECFVSVVWCGGDESRSRTLGWGVGVFLRCSAFVVRNVFASSPPFAVMLSSV
jgi:hypothetical protein